MNAVDILLGLDADSLGFKNEKELEIKRLSQKAGKPFIVKLCGVPARRFTRTISGTTDKSGTVQADKAYDANVNLCVIGLVDPSMKDKDLMERFGCSTPGELLEKIFSPAEIAAMGDAIMELSGFGGKDVVAEVKN